MGGKDGRRMRMVKVIVVVVMKGCRLSGGGDSDAVCGIVVDS